MFEIIKNVVNILLENQTQKLYFVVTLMLLLSVMELVGLGILIPVIDMLSNGVAAYPFLVEMQKVLHFDESEYIVFLLLSLLVLFFILKSIYALYVVYRQQYFVNSIFKSVSERILINLLSLPYEDFQSQDNSLYLKYVVTSSAYLSLCSFNVLQFFTELLVLTSIVVFLAFYIGVTPLLYLSVFLFFIFIIFRYVTKSISSLGEQRDNVMHAITKAASEALNGYREIRVDNVQAMVVSDYGIKIEPYIPIYSKFGMFSNLPRITLETITALLILGYMFYIYITGVPLQSVIQELVIFAFVGLRTLPALNKLLTATANIKYFGTEVMLLSSLIDPEKKYRLKTSTITEFNNALTLCDVSYSYPGDDKVVLDNISLTLEKNKKYGFVGRSGSGKSTLFDIILGFISPSSGVLNIDNVAYDTLEAVDMSPIMGIVPQSVFLLDASFKDNVVFYKPDQFDMDKFNEVVTGAQLSEFIASSIDRPVGENGANLSGGQKQRIAIARSLYSSKNILLLDEATSALDNQTEKQFIDYINKKNDRTLLIIAHRLSTVRQCDKIFVLKDGEIVSEGTYEYLLDNSDEFKVLASGELSEK